MGIRVTARPAGWKPPKVGKVKPNGKKTTTPRAPRRKPQKK